MAPPENGVLADDLRSPHFLTLPNELVVCIENFISNRDICRLARVNRRLRHVAEDYLYRELSVSNGALFKLLQTLSRRPDLARKITTINLQWCKASETVLFDQIRDNRHMIFRQLDELVDRIQGDVGYHTSLFRLYSKTLWVGVWGHTTMEMLEYLIAASPNLRKMSAKLPEWMETQTERILFDEVSAQRGLAKLLGGGAYSLLEQNLQDLQLIPSTYKSLSMRNITLQTLHQLHRLSIPMDAMMFRRLEPTPPTQTLPPNLYTLQIRPCNRSIAAWIPEFLNAYRDGAFRKMKRMQLYFELPCLRSTLLLIGHGQNQTISLFRDALHDLASLGLVPTVYSNQNVPAGEIMKEVDAWSHLSDFERWWASTKGMQFSTLVANNDQGEFRPRTALEKHALFQGIRLRSALDSWKFDLKVPAHEILTPHFGKREKPEVDLNACKFNAQVWESLISNFPSLPAASQYKKKLSSRLSWQSKRYIHRSSYYGMHRFPSVFIIPRPTTAQAQKFDAGRWANVVYFPESVTRFEPLAFKANERPTPVRQEATKGTVHHRTKRSQRRASVSPRRRIGRKGTS